MKKEAVSNFEEKLSSLLSGPDYEEVRKEIAQCTSIELDLKYKVFKPVDKMIKSVKICNRDYDSSFDDKINPANTYNESEIVKLNSVCKEAKLREKNAVSLKQHIEDTAKKKIKYIHAAYIPLEKCWNTMMERLEKIVKSIPGSATVDDALEDACIIMCPDGAVHTALGKAKNSIITYSLTLTSRFLIEKCGLFPSSGNNIMVHCQLNGKESLVNLVHLMKYRFKYKCKKLTYL